MANLCGNTVVLVGNPKSLEKVAEAIRATGKKGEYVSPEGIQEELGFEDDKWGHSYDIAMGPLDEINLDTINDGYLKFYCCTAWGDIRGYWDILCEECELDGFASSSDVDGEYWVVNDPDGIWFPENYVFDSYGYGTFADLEMDYYKTKEDLAEKLNEISEKNLTFDEWVKYMEEYEGDEGSIKLIEREGVQVYPYRTKETNINIDVEEKEEDVER